MSVGIFQNGKYNKVAGNAKDSTAANTTYNNGTSGLQANNVQSAIDELNSNLLQYNKIKYKDVTLSISTANTWLSYDYGKNETIGNNIIAFPVVFWSTNTFGFIQTNLNKDKKILWYGGSVTGTIVIRFVWIE